ncbi:MAG: sulfate reduction electron transfer complex DsrMKJOP subunit DsrJ [Thermodesulfobacteriota bacterium]
MYDSGKIVTGLVIFGGLVTFPIWYNALTGKTGYVPKPKIVTEEKQCIEPKEYIRTRHKDLLKDWRESVVRNGIRTYVASNRKEYTMSLTRTCMKCHSNKLEEFCLQCHNYMAVTAKCWDCHAYPKGINLWESTEEGS